jgi:dUTP pyrophosphatase
MESEMTSAQSSFFKPYYLLYVYLNNPDTELIEKYNNNFSKRQELFNKYNRGDSNICIDAGIDVFTSSTIEATGSSLVKINSNLKCAMYFRGNDGNNIDSSWNLIPSGFYVYPRSSTCINTPLRLANSVGIIDSGYRGEIIGLFDNIKPTNYVVEKYQRLFQICPPNLTYPIYPVFVNSEIMLESSFSTQVNDRCENGLGSTGL